MNLQSKTRAYTETDQSFDRHGPASNVNKALLAGNPRYYAARPRHPASTNLKRRPSPLSPVQSRLM